MEKINKRITLDLYSNGRIESINAQQGDNNSRTIEVELLNDGNPYNLADDLTILVIGTRGDGQSVYDTCTYKDNIIKYTMSNMLLGANGRAKLKIQITDDQENIISSIPFFVNVTKNPVDEDKVIATTDFSALQELIVEVAKGKSGVFIGDPDDASENDRVIIDEEAIDSITIPLINDTTPSDEDTYSSNKIDSKLALKIDKSKMTDALDVTSDDMVAKAKALKTINDKFSTQVATGSTLGLVKSGGDILVNSDGEVTVTGKVFYTGCGTSTLVSLYLNNVYMGKSDYTHWYVILNITASNSYLSTGIWTIETMRIDSSNGWQIARKATTTGIEEKKRCRAAGTWSTFA